MKNSSKLILLSKMSTSVKFVSSNGRGFLFNLFNVQNKQKSSPAKEITKKHSSLRNSLLITSSVSKGVILCPENARYLSGLIPKIRNSPILNYVDNPPDQGSTLGHEKILEEQKKQLEKLEKDLKGKEESGEKFPKYKPRP